MHVLQPAAERFSKNFPRTVEKLTKLEEGGARTALGFSRLAQFAAEAAGLTTLRDPDDTDLFAHNEDLRLVADILGVEVSERQIKTLTTGDGLRLQFAADEVLALADTQIQLVRPLTPMRDGAFCYQTAFSDRAVDQRVVLQTDEGLVPIAHPADAMLVYGIGQRNCEVKNDARNLGALSTVCELDNTYLRTRSQEVGADARVWTFIAAAAKGVMSEVCRPGYACLNPSLAV